MGFLKERYSKTYFTGLLDNGAKAHYGALGADDWRAGGIYAEIREPIDQIDLAGKVVLELGFGRGESARYLLGDVGATRYVGVDFSEAACELAEETLAAIARERWTLQCGDALEFLATQAFDEEFEAVLMLDTIEHIPTSEMLQILPMIYNALKPGGHLIVDTPFYPVDEDYIAQGFKYVAPSASDLIPETKGMHCNKFTRERLLREMCAAGFEAAGDKLFRKPLRAPLGLPSDAGWSGLFSDTNGSLWVMPGAKILLPARLFDGIATIGFVLTSAKLGEYGANVLNVSVDICGAPAGELRFSQDCRSQRFEVALAARGEDILIELSASASLNEPRTLPPRIAMISDLTVQSGDTTRTLDSVGPAVPARQTEVSRGPREKVEHIDGAACASRSHQDDRRASAAVHDGGLRVDRVEVIDTATRRLVSALVAGADVTIRCHLVAQREIDFPGCRYVFAQPAGAVMSASISGHGALKRLFPGERAIVEFSLELRVPQGEHRLVLAAGSYDQDGSWQDREQASTYAMTIAADSATRHARGAIQFAQTAVRPAASGREYCTMAMLPAGATEISFGTTAFRVQPHWFWEQFCSGWEPETFEVIRRFVRTDRAFLDVGCWVGPTTLIAAACGASRIVAVEANPRTAAHIEATLKLNSSLRDRVEIVNCCVHREERVVQFGNADGGDATSSASSLRGHGFAVRATRLTKLMQEQAVTNPSLVKIDIEGAEVFIGADLVELSERCDIAVYLSLHPPFWPEMGAPDELLAAISRFRIHDPFGNPIQIDELRARCESSDPYPVWGSPMGNFFEILLLPGTMDQG
jgi:FkbM family methyltransferase